VSGDDDQWLDQGDEGGLWEYQLRPLSVRSLAAALVSLDGELPIEIESYDGERIRLLRVMHIDLRGEDGHAVAVVMTVT
jgi:hypothetical protein